MGDADATILGDYVAPENIAFEGSMSFSVKAACIEKKTAWKSRDIAAEFLGTFWENMLGNKRIKSTLHFVCAELMENAVCHSAATDYMIRIQLCFREDELLVYVKNSANTHKIKRFKAFIRTLLAAEDLQKLFVKKMKDAKKTRTRKSQLGLITILKDRGARLAWKFDLKADVTDVTTLARIPVKEKESCT